MDALKLTLIALILVLTGCGGGSLQRLRPEIGPLPEDVVPLATPKPEAGKGPSNSPWYPVGPGLSFPVATEPPSFVPQEGFDPVASPSPTPTPNPPVAVVPPPKIIRTYSTYHEGGWAVLGQADNNDLFLAMKREEGYSEFRHVLSLGGIGTPQSTAIHFGQVNRIEGEDLVVQSYYQGVTSFLVFTSQGLGYDLPGAQLDLIGDFNPDAVFLAELDADGTHGLLLGAGDGTFGYCRSNGRGFDPCTFAFKMVEPFNRTQMVIADADGDGRNDVLYRSADGSRAWIHSSLRKGGLSEAERLPLRKWQEFR